MFRRTLPLLLATPALAQPRPPLFVLGTGATETPIERIAHALTARTGRAIRTETGNGGQVAARLRAGEAVDVVLNAAPALDALIRDGFALADSRREMGRMRLALAIRRGLPVPQMRDEAELAAILRAASSIGLSDGAAGATSGRHVAALLDRLGSTAPRIPFARGLAAVQAVARGEVGLVITQASEILAEPGAVLVAPLPESAQLITPYVAAVAARAADPEGARAFIGFAGGEGAAMFRAVGFQVL
ncbi:substrate-binding domain-containing protein [Sediminicoccus sp. KRV36]|uniref:substrate-binding domain-containing protein n=1 Tax=Sediminicoccus sp. KRV36 TaxID=3133721 RepID=UPI00200EADCE|nr:substrate-binding domain-containing protein [Sediminicoccus rosea]UPY36695.1 substrate-binding domain-containing protein [Sediminicoccus rosea]